mmetsp:Transcript_10624/g.23037  ORF Transcript_10624/g.23037 Transcript_10624/m.23037 type:complete len:195 (+) Transcript_10624:1047-1631(+)
MHDQWDIVSKKIEESKYNTRQHLRTIVHAKGGLFTVAQLLGVDVEFTLPQLCQLPAVENALQTAREDSQQPDQSDAANEENVSDFVIDRPTTSTGHDAPPNVVIGLTGSDLKAALDSYQGGEQWRVGILSYLRQYLIVTYPEVEQQVIEDISGQSIPSPCINSKRFSCSLGTSPRSSVQSTPLRGLLTPPLAKK